MIKIEENIILAGFTNYKIGGPARYFFQAKNVQELKEAIRWTKSKKQKIFILGGGTNLLFSDDGFKGLVLKPDINFLEVKGEKIKAGAGALMSDILKLTIKNKLSGLEWAGGLPGTLGGAIRGNAGAFRGETKDNIESVKSLNIKTLEISTYNNKNCEFDYRNSLFKKHDGGEIVLSAVLKFKKGDSKKIQASIQGKIDFRNTRHPLEYPNSGSVFKNVPITRKIADLIAADSRGNNQRKPASGLRWSAIPVKTDPFPVIPTAYLISEANLKGVSRGGAMISPKHPNFIVNVNNAKAKDVLALIKLVKSTIKQKFGITIEEEVQFLS